MTRTSFPAALLFPVLAVAAAALSGGCAATVYPQATPADPVPVFVADYGVHSSLFLPTPDGLYVEYAFGDWGYAAENHCMPQDAVGALTVSAQAALGRRYFELAPGQTVPRPADRLPNRMERIYCERKDAYAVVKELDERYRASGGPVVTNPENGIAFVPDAQRYSIANNCNHLTARLLEKLGCRVEGTVIGSNFQVVRTGPVIDDAAPRRASSWVSARVE